MNKFNEEDWPIIGGGSSNFGNGFTGA